MVDDHQADGGIGSESGHQPRSHPPPAAGQGHRPTALARTQEVPTWLGCWPAAIGLFAFVWLELVSPDSTYLGPLRLWIACYFAVMVVGSAVFGDRWLERADPFEVYSTLLAHLSPWGLNTAGRLVWVSPLRHLSRIPAEGGPVAVVAVLLGSTAYDSWRDSAKPRSTDERGLTGRGR